MGRLAWLGVFALSLFLLFPAVALADVHVQVDGAVLHPGPRTLPSNTRFADAVLAAMPDDRAYPLGASVLRAAAEPAQRRLKAGVLFDLDALAASSDVSPALSARAEALRQWIEAMPVTGRVRSELQARRLEADSGSNRPLVDGDRFLFPSRPRTVRVVGAVIASCELPQVPLRDAREYLHDCAIDDDAADRELLWVVQPDGQVQRLSIAAWNRSTPQALAPGAMLYVPLDEKAAEQLAPGLNDELAAFLATQPLPVDVP